MISFFKKNTTTTLAIFAFLYISLVYFNFAYSNIALIALSVLFILSVSFKLINIKLNISFLKNYLLIIVPFILTLISIFISDNKQIGYTFIIKRLSILLTPFILLIIFKEKEQFKKLTYVLLFFSLLALLITVLNIFKEDVWRDFNHNNFKNSTIIQHPYFGIYQLVTIVFLLEFLKDTINKKLFYLLLLMFSAGVLISTSRIAYILYLFIAFIYSLKYFTKKQAIIISSIIGVLFFSVVLSNKSISQKFTRSLSYKTSPRLKIWNNSYLVLKNSKQPLLGVGIGDYYEDKKEPYWLIGKVNALKGNYKGLYGYDSHNLYIEFILHNGLLGLSYTLLMLYTLYITLRKNDAFLISLAIILLLFSFTETIINRQYGVILYVFIMPILIKFSKKSL